MKIFINTTVRKMTEMCQCPNASAKNDQNVSVEKTAVEP